MDDVSPCCRLSVTDEFISSNFNVGEVENMPTDDKYFIRLVSKVSLELTVSEYDTSASCEVIDEFVLFDESISVSGIGFAPNMIGVPKFDKHNINYISFNYFN